MKSSFILAITLLAVLAHTKMLYTFNVIRHGAIYPKNDLYDGN